MFLLSLIFWLIFYALGTRLESARIREGRWAQRGGSRSATALAGTLIYATTMIVFGIPILCLDFNVGQANTWAQNTLLQFSLGWFIISLIWIFYEKFMKSDLILQHVICMTGLIWVLYTGRNGWEMTAAASVGEVLPCLYIGLLAKRWKYGTERFFFVNDSVFMISFILTRFFFFSVLAYLVVGGDDTHIILASSALALLLLSYYWGVLLIRKYLDRWGHKL
jgi:hypothetical protein